MDWLTAATDRLERRRRVGRLVLRLYASTFEKWEEEARQEEERWLRFVQRIQEEVWREEREAEEERWLKFVAEIQTEVWREERRHAAWCNRWQ